MIPEGTYPARGSKADFGTSKKKGTDFVRVQFQIAEGAEAGGIVAWDGWFTDNASQRTIESLRLCGCEFPNNDITNLEGIDRNIVHIVVQHERFTPEQGENEGIEQVRARVAWVNDPNRGGIPEDQVMDDGKKRAFAARMKGALVAAGRKAPASPNGRTVPRQAQQETRGGFDQDDEIPF